MNTNLIRKDKLEELLLSQWSSFIDFKKLLAYVLSTVRDIQFPTTKTEEIKNRGTQIKLSRFEPDGDRFTVWVEFTVAREPGVVVGTSELSLTLDGTADHVQTLGNHFVP